GAQGDAGIVRAIEAEPADRAGVSAALVFLQLVEDLHGPDFRRAGNGAGGKGRTQHVIRAVLGRERAGDVRDDVHDVTVTLDDHEIIDLHATVFGDAANVIAGEID